MRRGSQGREYAEADAHQQQPLFWGACRTRQRTYIILANGGMACMQKGLSIYALNLVLHWCPAKGLLLLGLLCIAA